jgi:lysozyme family protein
MRSSFDRAFELTVGLEGGYSNDPRDPGGETNYGISKRYHPGEDIKNMTVERAKEIYLNEYWIAAGCDGHAYPMDVCLFDSAVNPQKGGNKELLGQNPENWQELMLRRMVRYMKNSKDVYVKGHIFRVLKLFEQIKGGR